MKPIDIDELLYKLEDAYKRKSIQEQKIKYLENIERPGKSGSGEGNGKGLR
jgi:hypothetical protein